MSYRWSFNASNWEPTFTQLIKISGIIQPEEKARIGRFVFMKDAKSSLIGRLLIRKIVQIKTGVPNHLIKLGRDDHNKPILLSPPPLLNDHDQGDNVNVLELQLEKTSINSDSNLNLENLNFNVSHQGSYIVLASDPIATLIGIDVMNVEKPGRIADSVDEYFRLMNRQFTDNEWGQIKGLDLGYRLSDKKKMMNFTRFWCLKEAYVKAIGVGIVIDLRTIDFKVKTDLEFGVNREKVLATDTVLKVNGILETGWSFEERCLDDIHLVAVAKLIPEIIVDDKAYIPEFKEVSLDFLLENMTPLEKEDEEWVDKFLQKNKRK